MTKRPGSVFLINYVTESDNERKRIEHLLSTRIDKKDRLKGSFILVKDQDDGEKLVREISSKLDRGAVKLYQLKEKEFETEEHVQKIEMEFPETPDMAWMLLGYLAAKKKGRMTKQHDRGARTYNVLGRKGKATLDIDVEKAGKKSRIKIVLKGDEDVVEDVAEFFQKEIDNAIDAKGG